MRKEKSQKETGSFPFRERGIEEEEKDKETEKQNKAETKTERASETPAEGKEMEKGLPQTGQGTGDWRQTEGLTDTPKDHQRQRERVRGTQRLGREEGGDTK